MSFNLIVTILVLFLLIMVGVIIFDSNRFVVRRYIIESDKIDRDYTFLLLSDLHCKEYGKRNSRLKKTLDEISAEGCFVTGDFITAVPGKKTSVARDLLVYLNKKYKLFYSYGNHEYRAREYTDTYGDLFKEFKAFLDKENIILYDNEKIEYEGLDIYALTIDRKYYKRFKNVYMSQEYLINTLGEADNKKYSILLAHNPEYFKNYAKWGADLTLSGHVHGGIVRLPGLGGVVSPKIRFFPKYDGGEFSFAEDKAKKMIVSRGLGVHSIPIRMFNPAEIIVLNIKRS